MDWIKINDIRSDSIDGFLIKSLGSDSLAQRDIETIKVEGRNENLHIDKGTYNVIQRTIIGVMTDLTKKNDIKSFLNPIGKIELSSEEGFFRKYIITNQIPFDKYLTWLKEFPIQLELSPIAYSVDLTTVTKTTFPNTLSVSGNVKVNPILEIKGEGTITLTLNNKSFTLINCTSDAYIVDCDLMNVTKSNLQANDKFSGEFPELIIGTNNISCVGNITELKIKYRSGWL